MGILTKKIYRDLRYNKGRTISIIAIIAISTALYSGLLLGYENAANTFDDNDRRLNRSSVRFSTGMINPHDIDLSGISGIDNWDYRLAILTGLQIGDNADTTFTAPLFGVPEGKHPEVNDFDIVQGDGLDTYNEERILLIDQFIENHDLEVNDNVSIFSVGPTGKSIEVEIPIGGSVFSPEYLYVVNPKTGLPDLTGLSAGWMDLSYLQELFRTGDSVNEVLVRFSKSIRMNEKVMDDKIGEIEEELKQFTPQVSFTKLEDEPEEKMKEGDLGALDEMARLFGIVVLILALFGIYDNISKLIASQRNYIGTMRALGGSSLTVTLHYTSMALVLGFFGVVIGIPLGWGTGALMIEEYANILNIPAPSKDFRITSFIEAVSINFTLSLLSGFMSALAAANINPREAMSSSFITMVFRSKPLFERIFSKIPGFRSVSTAIPLRTIFRNRRKTAITIFTYAVALVLIISSLGFMDSFNLALDENYTKYEKHDLQIYFNPNNPIPTSIVLDNLEDIYGIDRLEVFVAQEIEMEHNGNEKATTLFGIQENSTLRQYNLSEKGSKKGLVIGELLANDLDIKIGDELDILNHTKQVSGITQETVSQNGYLHLHETQEMFSMGNNVSGILLSLHDNVDENDVKKELQETELPIALIMSTSEIQNSLQTLIQGLLGMLGILVFIGVVTVALFSFNTIVLEVIFRENEFVNLRSLGGGRGKIAKIIIIQGSMIALVGSVITIPLGFMVTDIIIQEMVEGLMVLPTYIKPESYIIAIGAALIATFVGIIAAIKHVMNLDLVEKLRTRISN